VNPTAATDFVAKACTNKTCWHQYAMGRLNNAGHQFANIGAHGGWLLVLALVALVAVIVWRAKTRSSN
jgi:hypothetical protein